MSDNVNIDLSNYKEKMSATVAPGRYKVVVEDAENDVARSGNKMINLWLKIQGGDFDGSTIVDRLVLSEKSLFRVVGFMNAIGMPTPKKKIQVNLRQFTGKTLFIDIEDGEPYNGRVRSEVRGYARYVPSQGDQGTEAADEASPDEDTSESAEDVNLDKVDL